MILNKTSNLIISLFTFIFIAGCLPSGNNTTPNPTPLPVIGDYDTTLSQFTNDTANSCNELNKNFSLKNVSDEKKPNENYRIKIIKKSFPEQINISNTYRFPHVFDLKFKGIKIEPAVIKTDFHKALSEHELKQKRQMFWKNWRHYLKEKYKYDRKNLRYDKKEERIVLKEKFIELIKDLPKSSPERISLIEEQIQLRQEIIDEYRDEREQLKNTYKEDIKTLKALLDFIYPKDNKNFSVKAVDEDFDAPLSNINSEKTDFYSLNTDKTFKINDTYVNNQPYTDQGAQVTDELFDFEEINDQDVQTLFSKGINIDGCANDVAIQRVGDRITIINKAQNENCNVSEVILDYKVTSDSPESCGQGNNIKMNFGNHKSFSVTAEIPFDYLGKGTRHEVFITFKTDNGNNAVVKKVGDFIPFSTKAVTQTDPEQNKTLQIVDMYNSDELMKKYNQIIGNTSRINEDIKNFVNNYQFGISNPQGIPYKFYLFGSQGNEICSTNCINTSKQDNLITFDKTNLKTDNYTIKITDKDGNLIKSKEFFVGNYRASTFTSNVSFGNIFIFTDNDGFSGTSQFLYQPSNTNANYFDYKVIKQPLFNNQGNTSTPSFNEYSSSQLCSAAEFISKTFDGNNQPSSDSIGNLDFHKYLFSKIAEEGNLNRFYKSDISSCPDSSIVVGGILDLTNTNISANKDIYGRNKNSMFYLVVEDEQCRELDRTLFSARAGTKHFVSKRIFPKALFGNFCESKVFYVKIKKAVNITPELIKNIQDGNNNNNPPSIDIFSTVKNTVTKSDLPNQNQDKYQGARGILSRCKGDLCHRIVDELKKRLEPNTLLLNKINNSFNNIQDIKQGDQIDAFDINFDYRNENDLKNNVEGSSPLTNSSIVTIDKNLEQIIKNEQNKFLHKEGIEKEFSSLQDKVDAYISLLGKLKDYYSPKGSIESNQLLDTNAKELEKAAKEILDDSQKLKNKFDGRDIIPQGLNKKFPIKTLPKIISKYNYVTFVIQIFIEQQIFIQENLNAGKTAYISTLAVANNVLSKTVTDECVKNASNLFLTRVRRYVTNYIINPLYVLNSIVDNSNPITDGNYNTKVNNLKNKADELKPRADAANTATDNQCKDKDPCQDQLLTITNFYNDYFIKLGKTNLPDKSSEKAYEGFFSNNNFFGNKYKSISFLSHAIYGHGGTAKENSLKGEAKQCKMNDITKTRQRVPQAKFSSDKKLFEAVMKAYELKMQTNERVRYSTFMMKGHLDISIVIMNILFMTIKTQVQIK